MIKEITFTVEEIGEFVIWPKNSSSFVYLNNGDLPFWDCDCVDEFCEMTSVGFRENFNERTGLRISEQEALEIWQNIIMFYTFLNK